MAGRAGRRGLDTTGTVIIVVGESLPEVFPFSTTRQNKFIFLLARHSGYDDSGAAREIVFSVPTHV